MRWNILIIIINTIIAITAGNSTNPTNTTKNPLVGYMPETGYEIRMNSKGECYYRSKLNCKDPTPIGCAHLVACDNDERQEFFKKMKAADDIAARKSQEQAASLSFTEAYPKIAILVIFLSLLVLLLVLALTFVIIVQKSGSNSAANTTTKTTSGAGLLSGDVISANFESVLDSSSLSIDQNAAIKISVMFPRIWTPNDLRLGQEEIVSYEQVPKTKMQKAAFYSGQSFHYDLILKWKCKQQLDKNRHNSTVQEAALLRSLCHENVIECRNLFSRDWQDFALVMPRMDSDLEDFLLSGRVDRKNPILTALAYQLANALSYVHNQQIIHADICTRNCLLKLGKEGQIPLLKLADFGLSIRRSENLDKNAVKAINRRWPPKEVVDSYDEQNVCFHVDFSTDIWYLGVAIFDIFIQKPIQQQQPEDGIKNESKRKSSSSADGISLTCSDPLKNFFIPSNLERLRQEAERKGIELENLIDDYLPLEKKALIEDCLREEADQRITAEMARHRLTSLLGWNNM